MSPNEPIEVTVSHRGTLYSLSLLPESTLASLYAQLDELTGVDPSNQKLLYKGKKPSSESSSISEAGIKPRLKLQMLGSTREELGGLRAVEDEQRRRDRIMKERARKAPVKLRSTGSSSSALANYKFHRLEPLSHLPNPGSALALLNRISNDPAIRHIMQKNELSVGLLTELAPHEDPEALGRNFNNGQMIKLRLRTNAYDGFRLYNDIRKVLCHELAHNIHMNHSDAFKELNSRLNREVAEYEKSVREGTHQLVERGDVYEASSELETHAYVLGGGSVSSGLPSEESGEDRRRKILAATVNRLRKEEEEIEHSCGTTESNT